jgi:hypothetical protein
VSDRRPVVRLAARLLVLALVGLGAVQAARDLPAFDAGSHVAAARRGGDGVRTPPPGDRRVEHDQRGGPSPGTPAPTSTGPVRSPSPVAAERRAAVAVAEVAALRTALGGAHGPRAPPV